MPVAAFNRSMIHRVRPAMAMRRILFVSCFYASDFGETVWGPFQRMRMLVEAACRVAPRVDLLLFASHDKVVTADPAAIAASIRRAWGVDVHVLLAARVDRRPGRVRSVLRWFGSFRSIDDHPDYGRAAGTIQSQAVTAAIHDDTDLVIAQKLESALPVSASGLGNVARIVDIDDVEHVSSARRMRQLAPSFAKLVARLRLPVVRRGELRTLDAFDAGLVCSPADRDYLAALSGTRIEVIPNAIAFDETRTGPASNGNRTILFLASYAYQPNVDAAEELMHAVFPRVLARVPDVELLIAGAFAAQLPSHGRPLPRTRIVGFVDDVAEVYRQASLVCCPIRAGGGTRIKIIEASAWKIPTVSTSLGAEGLDLRDGTEVLLAEDAAGLANHCIDLLEDPERGRTIGRAACVRAQAAYDRKAVLTRLETVYRGVVAARR